MRWFVIFWTFISASLLGGELTLGMLSTFDYFDQVLSGTVQKTLLIIQMGLDAVLIFGLIAYAAQSYKSPSPRLATFLLFFFIFDIGVRFFTKARVRGAEFNPVDILDVLSLLLYINQFAAPMKMYLISLERKEGIKILNKSNSQVQVSESK